MRWLLATPIGWRLAHRALRRDLIHANHPYPSVMNSRGCPHHTILEDLDAVRDQFAVVVTDENFIGHTDRDVEDREVLLEKMIRRNYRFARGCQASTKLATAPELMSLMHRAGCRAVFVGFESIDERNWDQVRKDVPSIQSKNFTHAEALQRNRTCSSPGT
jgi:hypothetical protein